MAAVGSLGGLDMLTSSRSNGCGLDIGVKGGKVVGVRGRAVDRVNKGRLGPKGMHAYGR